MIAELTSKETGVIGSPSEVSVVAHRVVHGGEKFTEATLLTDELACGNGKTKSARAACTIR